MNSLEREYRSDLARRYIAQCRREGRLQMALKLLALRFGSLTEPVEALVRSVEDAELDVFTHWALSYVNTSSTSSAVILGKAQ